MQDDAIDFGDNPAEHRFELRLDGQLAGFVTYRAAPGALALTHTEVLPQFEGQGLGSRLARAALDAVQARGLKVAPRCSFIAGWIGKHPEYRAMVQA